MMANCIVECDEIGLNYLITHGKCYVANHRKIGSIHFVEITTDDFRYFNGSESSINMHVRHGPRSILSVDDIV